ncbi:hypothetical protein B0H14DRAFT_2981035 [Mycena olivaceomarginata]|nr:hypothetical protein B0H14DRAFT_2981035 [Mycena olivaceomarginata]
MCTGHLFPVLTIIQVCRAPSSQRCSGRPATSANARARYVAAAFCVSSPQAAFLFARSPSHSPSSCTPAPVLYPL